VGAESVLASRSTLHGGRQGLAGAEDSVAMFPNGKNFYILDAANFHQ